MPDTKTKSAKSDPVTKERPVRYNETARIRLVSQQLQVREGTMTHRATVQFLLNLGATHYAAQNGIDITGK